MEIINLDKVYNVGIGPRLIFLTHSAGHNLGDVKYSTKLQIDLGWMPIAPGNFHAYDGQYKGR